MAKNNLLAEVTFKLELNQSTASRLIRPIYVFELPTQVEH